MKHFKINNVHANLGFFNLKRFLRKENQFFYTNLNGIVFPSMVFTTWRQANRKNRCLGYESLVLTRQSPAFNSVELGIPGVCLMDLKSDAEFKEKLIYCFKNDKNLVNFDPSTQKVSQICTFIVSCCAKYLMFELKKCKGVIFHDTEKWCKIWRKTDLCFGKWHEEFGKFSPEYSKVWKLGLWWDPFVQSRKCISLTFTEELYMCHDNEEWYKNWRGNDLSF